MQWIRDAAASVGFAVTALAVLAVCTTPAHAQLGTPVAVTCPETEDAHYFPVGSFAAAQYEGADSTLRQWYSNHLTAMAEPSLSCGELEGDEVYRFLVIPHFNDSIAVHISRRDDAFSLKAVMMNAADTSGSQPGPVAYRIAKTLTADQGQAVLDQLERIKFWHLETLSVGGYEGVRDGSVWILEARRDGRYHVVNRGTGDTTLTSIGRLLFDLAGIRTQPDEFNIDGTAGFVLPF